jgi:RNA polymerase sigma-70 factor (ECF subfamily)
VLDAIAACHASAPTAASTDWVRIAALYERLSRLVSSPVVALNRAVAVAMAEGLDVGLSLVDELERSGVLAGYHLLPARPGGPAAAPRSAGRSGRVSRGARPRGHRAERRYLASRLLEGAA